MSVRLQTASVPRTGPGRFVKSATRRLWDLLTAFEETLPHGRRAQPLNEQMPPKNSRKKRSSGSIIFPRQMVNK